MDKRQKQEMGKWQFIKLKENPCARTRYLILIVIVDWGRQRGCLFAELQYFDSWTSAERMKKWPNKGIDLG